MSDPEPRTWTSRQVGRLLTAMRRVRPKLPEPDPATEEFDRELESAEHRQAELDLRERYDPTERGFRPVPPYK